MAQHSGWLIALIPALALLIRLMRRPSFWVSDTARALRDLITLRMVLRDTEPEQRADLLDAHHSWRSKTPVPGPHGGRRSGPTAAPSRRSSPSRSQ
ncbi:hypothetical protein ACSCB1_00115 [Streptomyces europaeiscabiei]|uniref:hypothetical protein n=1 Tax=Streptomyces europaeiscabiei TaxID=146819 RepID=UPI003EB75159